MAIEVEVAVEVAFDVAVAFEVAVEFPLEDAGCAMQKMEKEACDV